MKTSTETVAAYYDRHQLSYSLFWSPSALHYGFWYVGTKRLADAIANTDRFIVDMLDINRTDMVLDAGCGVGGSSLFIAEATGARVEGITISRRQLRAARRRIAKSQVSQLVAVSQQDYRRTTFESETFSKVFAVESICHADDKLEALKEAHRILRPSGRIAIVDAFLTERFLDADEQRIYQNAIDGWAVPNLLSCAEFSHYLRQTGFSHIMFRNMQEYVWPSINRIYYCSLVTYPVNRILTALGLARRNWSARFQKALFDRGIARYGVFTAEKLEVGASAH